MSTCCSLLSLYLKGPPAGGCICRPALEDRWLWEGFHGWMMDDGISQRKKEALLRPVLSCSTRYLPHPRPVPAPPPCSTGPLHALSCPLLALPLNGGSFFSVQCLPSVFVQWKCTPLMKSLRPSSLIPSRSAVGRNKLPGAPDQGKRRQPRQRKPGAWYSDHPNQSPRRSF